MWRPQVEGLARSHRVLAPDLPGFGDSALAPGPFSFAGDLAELLDQLAVERLAVVGSSFGGRVALDLTELSPDRVDSLVLLCAAAPGIEPTEAVTTFEEAEERLLESGDVDGAVELNVSTWLGPDADDAARDLVRVMQRRAFDVQIPADDWSDPPTPVRIDPALSTFDLPTVVVSGRHDLDHFQQVARHLATTIPGADLIELPWAGHLPSLERPDEITALLLEVLDREMPT
jgi:pimeloyl-ACP methyl ester carboxylesterase